MISQWCVRRHPARALDLDHVGVMVLRPAMKRQFFAWTRAEPILSSYTCTAF